MKRLIHRYAEMNFIDIINEIEKTYIEYMPNINLMEKLCKEYGLDVRYKDSFLERWYKWITFNDCDYEVKPNEDGMRNYTS